MFLKAHSLGVRNLCGEDFFCMFWWVLGAQFVGLALGAINARTSTTLEWCHVLKRHKVAWCPTQCECVKEERSNPFPKISSPLLFLILSFYNGAGLWGRVAQIGALTHWSECLQSGRTSVCVCVQQMLVYRLQQHWKNRSGGDLSASGGTSSQWGGKKLKVTYELFAFHHFQSLLLV